MRKRAITKKDLDLIDELAAFYTESKENAKLLRMMITLNIISNAQGGAEVFFRRVDEMKAKRNDT